MRIGWNGIKKYGKYLLIPEKTILRSSKRLFLDFDSLNNLDPKYGHWFIHPCVRYVPQGFSGHKWWMVVTPYPNYNNKYENPVLYYGLGNDVKPPAKWEMVGVVQGSHDKGYNADCNLFFDEDKIWIIWKEKDTENSDINKTGNCIMCRPYDGKNFGSVFKLFDNDSSDEVHLIAPSVLNVGDKIICYATAYDNKSTMDSCHPHGYNKIAVWSTLGGNFSSGFSLNEMLSPNCPKDFDYWHADFCFYDGIIYSVVSNQIADTILFGRSLDGKIFEYIETPLFSRKGNNYKYMYKPSLVIIDGKGYVFFPKKKFKSRSVDIFYGEFNLSDIIYLFE